MKMFNSVKDGMKNTIAWFFMIVLLYFAVFLFFGVLEASIRRGAGVSKGCVYKSYLSIYNPAFRLGCELAKDRTN